MELLASIAVKAPQSVIMCKSLNDSYFWYHIGSLTEFLMFILNLFMVKKIFNLKVLTKVISIQ